MLFVALQPQDRWVGTWPREQRTQAGKAGKPFLLSGSASQGIMEMKLLCELPRAEQRRSFLAHWIMASTLGSIFCFKVESAG